ncbi:MAG: deoxyguanosinetriphosphate triphosphohydrolase [Hyphomicrobiaceae bacterium]
MTAARKIPSEGGALQPREDRGQRHLAGHASWPSDSRGRLVPEPDCPMRTPFQRDRDRIVHSTAFRRLTHKTQVFIYHEGDHYRSRLTHSIEVAQIARALARLLNLDDDLAEALALAHDLGHPPFGHAGERALERVTGLFDHNAQSLAVVTRLERKYAAFDGLNLAWETLEGLVKHNGPLTGRQAGAGARKVPEEILAYDRRHDLRLAEQPSAEAQVAAIADDIAYNNHDIDDGLRAGLITIDMLREVELTRRFIAEVEEDHGPLEGPRMIYEVNRRLITQMIEDVAGETRRRLALLQPQSVEDIRAAEAPVVAFSQRFGTLVAELKSFLFSGLYRHAKVMERMGGAESIVADLFGYYLGDPAALPGHWAEAARAAGSGSRERVIVDFVAGMTDRYAITEHRRLFASTPDLGPGEPG